MPAQPTNPSQILNTNRSKVGLLQLIFNYVEHALSGEKVAAELEITKNIVTFRCPQHCQQTPDSPITLYSSQIQESCLLRNVLESSLSDVEDDPGSTVHLQLHVPLQWHSLKLWLHSQLSQPSDACPADAFLSTTFEAGFSVPECKHEQPEHTNWPETHESGDQTYGLDGHVSVDTIRAPSAEQQTEESTSECSGLCDLMMVRPWHQTACFSSQYVEAPRLSRVCFVMLTGTRFCDS